VDALRQIDQLFDEIATGLQQAQQT
jgi:hypothetical protein